MSKLANSLRKNPFFRVSKQILIFGLAKSVFLSLPCNKMITFC